MPLQSLYSPLKSLIRSYVLFCLAAHDAFSELERANLEINVAFADDLVIAGDFTRVLAALQTLTASAAPLGLEINLSKCEIIPTAGREHRCDLSSIPTGVRVNVSKGFKLLGAPVGSSEFAQTYAQEKVAKVAEALQALAELPDKHVAMTLLRHTCNVSRVMNFMRTTPRAHIQDQAL